MTSISENKSRQRFANALIFIGALLVFGFWGMELRHALERHDQQANELVAAYQEHALDIKAEQVRDLFNELYTNSRTISLLPMIRSVQGQNRRSADEDVVKQGRLSPDTHLALQQIYTNLQSSFQISEIYYVLDGFDPRRGDVPFFMYDDHIVGINEVASSGDAENAHAPAEVEDFEYAHFPVQLDWFRTRAPENIFSKQIDRIPVRLSPMMRTCDNTQFVSEQFGNVRDAEGLIYSMPVYALDSNRLRGMITTIVRHNVLEARLLDVPFLPVTEADIEKMNKSGWKMPEKASPFVLRNIEYGFDIFDRRQPAFAKGVSASMANEDGRWASKTIDLRTGQPWELHLYLNDAELKKLGADHHAAKQQTLIGRFVLLLILSVLLAVVIWLIRRGRRELMHMAHYDSLTELPNRRAFFERLGAVIARCQRTHTKAGLFFVDIAGFNAINDALGQHAGDQLLAEVAQRLVASVRASDMVTRNLLTRSSSDTVSRLGGDEFTILCEDLHSEDDLAPVAERIMAAMRQPILIDGSEVEASVYLGIASYPADAKTGEALLMAAEGAMQQCRESGPGYVLYNEEMRKRAARQHQLLVELQMALERKQFQLFHQPKATLCDGKVVSLEALLRWKHPEFGMISPVEFIPLLERNGRIVEVGEWVLAQSCRDLNALSALGHTDLRISVNVSVRQLRRGNFPEIVARVLAETGVTPDRIILEITESMVMENLEEGQLILESLTALGVRLAIDDFGTGYSSLTYLQHLPLNYLKLDKSFIDGMTNDRARHIVRSVILLAQGIQLQTIAEGIETEAQRDELRELGCDMIQGYLLSKPKPLDEITAWLSQHSV